jgi:hypothetical protein
MPSANPVMRVGAVRLQPEAERESRVADGVFLVNQDRPELELLELELLELELLELELLGRVCLLVRSASFEAPEFVLAFLQDRTCLEVKG